jgi:poly-beta-hydroxyalkanoate depolymerase
MIDLDDMGAHYEGRACAYDDNPALLSISMLIKTVDKATPFHLRLPLFPIDPRNGEPTTWNQLASLYPNVVFPTYAETDLSLTVRI